MRRSGFDPRSAYMRFVVDKVALGQVFLTVFLFYPLNIISTNLYTHPHLRVAVTRRTKERSLGTFQKVKFFRKWGIMGYKNRLTFTFSVLRGLKPGEPFIFTLQNVSCHSPSTPVGYFILSRDNFNLQCKIISDHHNSTTIHRNNRYHLCDVTLSQFVTH